MGENEVENENVNEFYKEKIYELVAHCDNERWLRAILTCTKKPRVCALPLAFLYF